MAINPQPLNPVGNLAQLMAVQQGMEGMQAQRAERQRMASLRDLMAQPGAVDEATGLPTAATMGRMEQYAPGASVPYRQLSMRERELAQQGRELELRQSQERRTQTAADLAAQEKEIQLGLTRIGWMQEQNSLLLSKYDKLVAGGMPAYAAQAQVNAEYLRMKDMAAQQLGDETAKMLPEAFMPSMFRQSEGTLLKAKQEAEKALYTITNMQTGLQDTVYDTAENVAALGGGVDAEGKPVPGVVAEKIGTAAAQKPGSGEKPDPLKTITLMSPDGTQYETISESDKNATGKILQRLEQGWTKTTRVQQGSPSDFTQKTQSDVQTQVVATDAGLDRLDGILSDFKPEYLTLPNRYFVAGASALEKVGFDLPESVKNEVTAATTFKTTAMENLNRYIKEVTGAQMSEAEASRIRKAAPDPENDGPTEFRAKLEAVVSTLKRARERYGRLLAEGKLAQGGKITDELASEAPLEIAEPAAAVPGSQPSMSITAPQAAPAKVASDADYDALPSGARFIGPDGVLRVKP